MAPIHRKFVEPESGSWIEVEIHGEDADTLRSLAAPLQDLVNLLLKNADQLEAQTVPGALNPN